MATWRGFEDLEAWQKAREMCREVYRQSRTVRFLADPGLREQIREAAVSVMANIAEGFNRDGNREFLQYLSQAKGSAAEVASHLYVALDERYIDQAQFDAIRGLLLSCRRLIAGLMHYIRRSSLRGLKFTPSKNQEPGTKNP